MVNKENKVKETFFSHDKAARGDEKIVKMFFELRKNKNNFSESMIRDLLPFAGYGVYWSVVEYMHRNNLKTSETEILADEFRIDTDFLAMIMDKFELFRKEDELYVNDRINRNLEYQETKSEEKSKAAKVRWSLGRLKECYKEIFGKESPALTKQEINIFLDYADKIDDFKKKLPDILYTTKNLKFKNNPDFDPGINWLLTDNHLGKLLNGEYGALKNWAANKEAIRKKKEAEAKEKETAAKAEAAAYFDINSFDSKVKAMDFVIAKNSSLDFISPPHKELMKKFDIKKNDLVKHKEQKDA